MILARAWIPISVIIEAIKYEAYTFASSYLENNGNGTFKVNLYPKKLGLALIDRIIVNKSPNRCWKQEETEVKTPGNDAKKGLLLEGTMDGKFENCQRNTVDYY